MNDDTISRQAAIDVLEERLQANGYSNTALVSELNRSIGYLMRLPSAERRGSWIGIDDEPCDVWECDRCGHIVERECPPRFCEECGARMEVE